MAADLNPGRVLELLGKQDFWSKILVEDEVTSTNTVLMGMAKAGEPCGTVLAAERQTGGMGRNGRQWFSPGGRNLYFSMLLRPDCTPGIVPQLAIVAGLSLCKSIKELSPGFSPSLKWPNDVWMNGKKLCGILCSMSCLGMKTEYAVAGLGINVNLAKEEYPPELQETGTSLRAESGHFWERSLVLAGFLRTFAEDYASWLGSGNLEPFIDRWDSVSMLAGKQISVEQGNTLLTGRAGSIETDGRLVIIDSSGAKILAAAGDSHIIL